MSLDICFYCDFCGMPLTKMMLKDPEGRYGETPCSNIYFTKELNTKRLFPHLCENCATKIDRVLVFAKDEWLKQIDISDRNSKINAARRELLGTKG